MYSKLCKNILLTITLVFLFNSLFANKSTTEAYEKMAQFAKKGSDMNKVIIELYSGDYLYALYSQTGFIRDILSFRNSFMVNKIKITNNSKEDLKLESCEFAFMTNNRIYYKAYYDSDWLKTEIAQGYKYTTNPSVQQIYRTPFYSGNFVADLNIPSKASIVITNQYFEIYTPAKINKMQILCNFENHKKAKKEIAIVEYKQKNKYILPMKGTVALLGGPYEIWGHRTKPNQEFAYDLIILDNELKPYSKDALKIEDHYCIGKDILAVADGTVIQALDGLKDNLISYDRKGIEKFSIENGKGFPPLQASGGNFVIIDHGQRELSFYGHLLKDSIKVKTGDKVKQGDVIAKCGSSGEGSTSPHLHFGFMNDSDFGKAVGLPIKFENIEGTYWSDKILEKIGIPFELKEIFIHSGIEVVKTK